MSQGDVLKIMRKNPKKGYTSKELKTLLKQSTINENLKKLYKSGDVSRVYTKVRGYVRYYTYYLN